MDTLLIVDMLPTYGLLCYLLIGICVTLAFRELAHAGGNRRRLRFAVIMLLIGSLSAALLAYATYIIAMPYAQPDMVDFYHTYRPAVLVFLTGLFCVQFVSGVSALYRRKQPGTSRMHG